MPPILPATLTATDINNICNCIQFHQDEIVKRLTSGKSAPIAKYLNIQSLYSTTSSLSTGTVFQRSFKGFYRFRLGGSDMHPKS